MNGELQVTSILHEGSTFTFDVRAKLADLASVEVLSLKRVKQIAPGQKKYRIAIVDDNETNSLVLASLLELVGFQVRTASNGEEAIALWHSWQPDLIWMDMRMPMMDGYKATRIIKNKSGDKQQTVIIALTASAFEEQRKKIQDAGCDDFVAKPFTEQIIFDKLTQYLGVKFIYDVENFENEHKTTSNIVKPLESKDLAVLSTSLVAELNQAAIAVDSSQIEELITQIPATQQYIARAIAEMLDKYDFDAIVNLTEI